MFFRIKRGVFSIFPIYESASYSDDDGMSKISKINEHAATANINISFMIYSSV